MHVLIDTNCWIDLITAEPPKQLNLLEHWVNEHQLILLIPEILATEWEAKKAQQLTSLKNSVSDLKNLGPYAQLQRLRYNDAKSRAERIDKLMSSGNCFAASDRARIEAMKHFEQRRAPFHRKNNNSNSDALLFLSTVDQMQALGIEEFTFITRDTDDFSSPENKRELHVHLQNIGATVRYYTAITHGFHALGQHFGDLQIHQERSRDYIDQYTLEDGIETLPLIDQLHASLNKYYDEIPFIPTHILTRIFPFRIPKGTHRYSYYSAFRINSNNEALVKLFKALTIDEENNLTVTDNATTLTSSDLDKLHGVIQKLNRNLVFDISRVDKVEQANIRLHDTYRCPCIRCVFQRLDFHQALKDLNADPSSRLTETIKQAYIHFQLGFLEKSLLLYHFVYAEARSQEKPILTFICLYNLKRVANLIDGYFIKVGDEATKVLEKVKALSIREYSLTHVSEHPFVQDVVKWIAEDSFYTGSFKKISQALDSIRDHYYTQINGGWVSNSSYQKLVHAFAEIDEFLNRNCIVYNNYTEFETIVEKLLEGLLTIYRFNPRQIPHLTEIDQYFLMKVLLHVQPAVLQKQLSRAQIPGLRLSYNSAIETPFEEFAAKFFSDLRKIRQSYGGNDKMGTHLFWEKYRRVFANILLVLTAVEIEADYSNTMESLLDALEDDVFLAKFNTGFVAEFIASKGGRVTTNLMRTFLTTAIQKERLHDPSLFSAVKQQALMHHPTLVIDDQETFQAIKDHFLEKCKKCDIQHKFDILIHLYPLLCPQFKERVSTWATGILRAQFNPDAYYLLAMYDVVDYQEFFDQFMTTCHPPTVPQRTLTHHFTDAHVDSLNFALNLAFQFNIATDTHPFDKFQGISPYYDWLLNIEGFDYTNFNPDWILQHQSAPYLKRILTSKQVREALRKYLLRNKHEVLAKLYIEYDTDNS